MRLSTLIKSVSVFGCFILLSACGGGGGGGGGDSAGDSSPSAEASTNLISSEAEAARFMAFASLGATKAEVGTMVGRDAANWLREEFNKPATLLVPDILSFPENRRTGRQLAPYNGYVNATLMKSLIQNDDELRTRMVFALSQILVVGNNALNDFRPVEAMHYVDTLASNAFGNYRQLLEEVTLSPVMSDWLTYRNNRKGDPSTGRVPDENYARELLQLFSLGLLELNDDGTLVLEDGSPKELYGNDDIVNLARVFTGFSTQGRRFGGTNNDPRQLEDVPLQIFDDQHSQLEKNFLNVSIPANTSGQESLQLALDGIFAHPNIAPFIGRQLIQRFTSSSPSPAYVERVSNAFNSGSYTSSNGTLFGAGSRGDLEATLAAILLDESVFGVAGQTRVESGKVQEPLLNFVRWARIFEVEDFDHITRETRIRSIGDAGQLQMRYFGSPSVFNFYRPGYVPPNTLSGNVGLTVPEFQLFDTTLFLGYANFMADFVYDDSPLANCFFQSNFDARDHNPCRSDPNNRNAPSFTPNYAREIELADLPTALVDHLDMLLTGDRMLDEVKDSIIEAVESISLDIGSSSEAQQRDERVKLAVFMAVTSPSYMVFN